MLESKDRQQIQDSNDVFDIRDLRVLRIRGPVGGGAKPTPATGRLEVK
jgi:hypothetical protein